jgi:hypothetical protein
MSACATYTPCLPSLNISSTDRATKKKKETKKDDLYYIDNVENITNNLKVDNIVVRANDCVTSLGDINGVVYVDEIVLPNLIAGEKYIYKTYFINCIGLIVSFIAAIISLFISIWVFLFVLPVLLGFIGMLLTVKVHTSYIKNKQEIDE